MTFCIIVKLDLGVERASYGMHVQRTTQPNTQRSSRHVKGMGNKDLARFAPFIAASRQSAAQKRQSCEKPNQKDLIESRDRYSRKVTAKQTMSNGYIIANAPIAVDYWRRFTNPPVRFYFLTHCHADHTQGLSKNWRRRIYCSPTTAKLAAHLFGIDPKLFIPIELDETITIDYDDDQKPEKRSFHVTALEADHCPGAVMFLFDGWFGRILCTGDFRYELESQAIDIDRLRFHAIDRLYLDATNWRNGTSSLPCREEAIEKILETISKRPDQEMIVLAMPQARLGKERLLRAIARRFKQRICVDPARLATLKVLGVSNLRFWKASKKRTKYSSLQLDEHFTDNALETRFHVANGSPRKISRMIDAYRAMGRNAFVLILTSLPYLKEAVECQEINQQYSFNTSNAAVIPYSDHSSRKELEAFLDCLRVRQITLVGCEEPKSLTLDEAIRFEKPEELNEDPFTPLRAQEKSDLAVEVCARVEPAEFVSVKEEEMIVVEFQGSDISIGDPKIPDETSTTPMEETVDGAGIDRKTAILTAAIASYFQNEDGTQKQDQDAQRLLDDNESMPRSPEKKEFPTFLINYETNMLLTDREIDFLLEIDPAVLERYWVK